MHFVLLTFAFVNINVVAGAVVSVSVRFIYNLIVVPCSFLLLLFVFVGDALRFVHLVVSVLQVVLPIPFIPHTKSLALIMLAR